MTNPRELPKSPEKLVLEFSPLIVMELVGEPETRYEIIIEPLSCCPTRFVLGRVSLNEPRKMVDHNQNVFVPPFAFLQMQVVDTDKFK